MLSSDLCKIAIDSYNKAKTDELDEMRAWDICHHHFAEAIQNPVTADKDFLALNLGMYLANWGMYRGSAFIRGLNYREHMPVVDILLKPAYRGLLDIDFSDYINHPINLDKLTDVTKNIEDYYDNLRKKYGNTSKQAVSRTLITKILLATLGCVPAYDQYFYKGVVSTGVTTGTFNAASIKKLAKYYMDNYAEFEATRKKMINLENGTAQYPAAKLLDIGFFSIGMN